VNKFFLYLFLLLILSSCGIDNKEIEDQNENSKIIFEKSKPIKKELNSNLKIKLNKLTKGEVFLGNNTNSVGNINFETNFNKTTSYKFSAIKEFNFNQPELIFTNDESIVFFDGKGSIFKINKDLNEIWKVNHYTKKEKKLKPIIYFAQTDKKIIAADNLFKIYLINLNDGNLIKSIESNTGFNSNIKVSNDRFFIVDFENTIRCFSTKDGLELWNFDTENPFIKSKKKLSLVIKGELVFFINSIGDLTALNINNGSLFWQTPTQSNIINQDAFTLENSDLVFANDSIYFSNNKNELFSIDARTGIVNWKQTVNSSLTPTIIENLVFVVSNEGYLFIIDNKKGNIIRITNMLKNIKNKKNEIKPSGFVIARNKIYLSLNNGRLIKSDVTTGIEENVFKISNSKILRPNIFGDKMYLLKHNAIIKTE
jgi:outer membrane protein assembly factor BamB